MVTAHFPINCGSLHIGDQFLDCRRYKANFLRPLPQMRIGQRYNIVLCHISTIITDNLVGKWGDGSEQVDGVDVVGPARLGEGIDNLQKGASLFAFDDELPIVLSIDSSVK